MNNENKDILINLLNQHKELGIPEQIDYNKFYLYSIITHSTAIEGSTVTEVEAQLLFDEGITSSKRTMIEQMMNLDLKAAYDYGMKWIRDHEDITVDWLVYLASKVMARTGSEYKSLGGDFSAARGELRKLNVTAGAGGKSYTREEEDINIFLNTMASLHCRHLKYDIDTFISSVAKEMDSTSSPELVDKHDVVKELVDKWSIKPNLADKLADILVFMADKDEIRTEMIVGKLGFTETTAKRYLRQLTEFGYLEAHGGNKNRTYVKKA